MARVRAFLLVLPLLLLATVIAGCGGESDEKSFPSASGGYASASRDFDTSDDEFRPDSPIAAGAFDPAPAPDALSAGPASGSPSRGESFDQDTASTVGSIRTHGGEAKVSDNGGFEIAYGPCDFGVDQIRRSQYQVAVVFQFDADTALLKVVKNSSGGHGHSLTPELPVSPVSSAPDGCSSG